jgi:hypothetical protein
VTDKFGCRASTVPGFLEVELCRDPNGFMRDLRVIGLGLNPLQMRYKITQMAMYKCPLSLPQGIFHMSEKTQTGLDILIIGAGVCGLTTATALAQKGHRVRVLENEGALNESGASITILPCAERLLLSWGLEDGLKKYGTPIRCFTSKDGATGEVVCQMPCNDRNMARISFDAEYSILVDYVS